MADINGDRAQVRKAYKDGKLTADQVEKIEHIDGWVWEERFRWTQETFIAKLKEVNPDIKVLGEFKTVKHHVNVECEICGHKWETKAQNLLGGHGCPICNGAGYRRTHDDFVRDMREQNPDIEVLGRYERHNIPVKLRCKICGFEWEQAPKSLLGNKGRHCSNCTGHRYSRISTIDFSKKAEEQNPNIKVIGEYRGIHKPVKVQCRACGYKWSREARRFLIGANCPQCKRKRKLCSKKKGFLARFKEVNPHLELVGDFFSLADSIKVKCRECGYEWMTKPLNLIHHRQCVNCFNRKQAKPVCNIDTGEIFESIHMAAKSIGQGRGQGIRDSIARNGTAGGYHWEYVTEE